MGEPRLDVTRSASIRPSEAEENRAQGGDLIAIVSAISEVQAKLDSQHTRMSQLERTVDSMATELRNLALQVQRSTTHNVSPPQHPSHAEGDVRAIPRDLATRPGAGALPKAFTTSHIQQTPTYPSGRKGDFATGNDFDNSQIAAYSSGGEEGSENGNDRFEGGNESVNEQPETSAYSASWEGGSENGNDPNDQQAAAFSDGEGAFETENFNGYESD